MTVEEVAKLLTKVQDQLDRIYDKPTKEEIKEEISFLILKLEKVKSLLRMQPVQEVNE